jgi:hypothetical protein
MWMSPDEAKFLYDMIDRRVAEQLAKLGPEVEIAIRRQREHDGIMNAIAAAHADTRPDRKCK